VEHPGFDALMQSVYSGDERAVRSLVEEYGDLLARTVRRTLPDQLRAHADSADFIQETWLAFVRDLPKRRQFDSPAHLAQFLATVAKRRVIDGIRKAIGTTGDHPIPVSAPEESSCLEPFLSHDTPSQSVMRREFREIIIKELRPAHQVVARHILEGRSPDEVASTLGISTRTVMRVRDRLLVRLRTV